MIRRAIAESLAHATAAGSASPRAARRRPDVILGAQVDISGAEVDISGVEVDISGAEVDISGAEVEADVISLDELDDSQPILLDEPSPQAVGAPPAKRSRPDPDPAPLSQDSDTQPSSLPSAGDDTLVELTPPMPALAATPPGATSPSSQLSEEAAVSAAIAASPVKECITPLSKPR
jgi:hypothetical protein